MGTTKRGTGKSSKTPAKRTVRKKKPKVVLKTKSVVIMASSIIAVCVLVLGLTFILSRLPSPSESKMSETAWKKAPAGQPIEEVEIRDIAEPKKSNQEKSKAQDESNVQKEKESSSNTINEENVLDNSKREKESEEKPVKTQEKAQDKPEGQKGLAQDGQKESQEKTEGQGTKEQAQATQKTAIQPTVQKQDKIASVKVTPTPQIQEIPKKLFDVPQAKAGARICFVIDDAGSSTANVKRYTSLPFPITIAVLPKLAQSAECAQAVRSAGKELILHQPMQAHNYPDGRTPDPGPGAILPDMDSFEVARTIKSNLDSLGGGVKGFNNHEGSLITENY
ncbi:MAG: divergent polysaccharide deacetylase family protein, partial [Treponema sp.]|nr:divergent polysaccharide deacetylase family protein [Treponema sp.]